MRNFTPQLSGSEFRTIIAAQLRESGIDSKGLVVPSLPVNPALHDRTILFVDDSVEVFKVFLPRLVIATNGKASFIRCSDGDSQELVRRIIISNPSILVIDGQLGDKLRGWDVVTQILAINPKLLCVGFSSDPSFEKYFSHAGAIGFVHKQIGKPEQSLTALSKQIGSLLNDDAD